MRWSNSSRAGMTRTGTRAAGWASELADNVAPLAPLSRSPRRARLSCAMWPAGLGAGVDLRQRFHVRGQPRLPGADDGGPVLHPGGGDRVGVRTARRAGARGQFVPLHATAERRRTVAQADLRRACRAHRLAADPRRGDRVVDRRQLRRDDPRRIPTRVRGDARHAVLALSAGVDARHHRFGSARVVRFPDPGTADDRRAVHLPPAPLGAASGGEDRAVAAGARTDHVWRALHAVPVGDAGPIPGKRLTALTGGAVHHFVVDRRDSAVAGDARAVRRLRPYLWQSRRRDRDAAVLLDHRIRHFDRRAPQRRTSRNACGRRKGRRDQQGGRRDVTGLMQGKRGLIMGLANDKSLAWGIAKKLSEAGAEIAFSYQGEAMEKRVRPLAEQLGVARLFDCDVSDMAALGATFAALAAEWPRIDFVVHANGFSDKTQLRGRFADTTLDNFLMTMNISVYSFVAVAQRAAAMMTDGGSLLTLSYYGAEKVIPHYNVMGLAKAALETSVKYLAVDLGRDNIRVNAISAGPIQTLAARGIGDFNYIKRWNELNSPLKRNVTIEDVGGAGLYLLSDLASGVTGETHHVAAGYNVVSMKAEDAPDISVV